MENSFETLWRLVARAARSLSENRLTRERAEVSGNVMVDEEADDETDVEIMTDMEGHSERAGERLVVTEEEKRERERGSSTREKIIRRSERMSEEKRTGGSRECGQRVRRRCFI